MADGLSGFDNVRQSDRALAALLGMFTGFLNTGVALILVASAWGILMLFNLITLPVEFDASARARLVLRETGLIRTAEEDTAVAQVLRAAAWNYVAAFITSLAYFLLHLPMTEADHHSPPVTNLR
jgi:uncharacterized protein